MKTLKDVMTSDVVWISPSARVKTAIILLKGHAIDALPVVYSHDAVVGIIYSSNLLGQDESSSVLDVMDKNFVTVSPDTPVYQAAEMMKVGGHSHLLIVEAGRMTGIVSRSDVVAELGKSYDTLTRLPWQDALREWSIGMLDRGREISIVLLDLDLFGKFNKNYGHVMGDNVLKSVANVMSSMVDIERDFLCRYGGDEFAIASLRSSQDATELGTRLVERIGQIELPGLPETIGATFGIAGGRRIGGREQAHSAATLDDLINNASLNCTLLKPHKQEAAEEEPVASEPVTEERATSETVPIPVGALGSYHERLKIQTIRISTSPSGSTAQVTLSLGEREYTHAASGYSTGGRSLLRLVAEATASSVSKSLSPGHGVTIDDVTTFRTGDDRDVVSVIATFITPRSTNTTAGSAVVRHSDPHRAAAAALLAAVNRQIAIAPLSHSEPEKPEAAEKPSEGDTDTEPPVDL